MNVRNLFFFGFAAAALFAACDEKDDVVSGSPSITLSANTLELEQTEDQGTITLTANRDWVVNVPSSVSSWLTVSPTSGAASEDPQTITVTVEKNTGANRDAEIEFSALLVSAKLTVTQKGPGGELVSGAYDDIYAAKEGDAVSAKGMVVGIYKSGMVLNEGADNILCYNSKSNFVAPDVQIGDSVRVSGTKAVYGSLAQIGFSYDDIEVITTGGSPVYPQPTVMDASNIASFDRTGCVYIQMEGALNVNGNYYNIAIDGASVQGSISYPLDSFNLPDLDGRRAVFTGYYCGGGTASFLNMLLVEVSESDTPYLLVSPSAVSVPADGGKSNEISITGNVSWTAVCDNPAFTLSKTSGTGSDVITVSADANASDAVLSANITISTVEDVAVKSYTVAVKQMSPAGMPSFDGNVTFSLVSEGNIYTVEESAKINGSEEETTAIKFGTGKKTGKATFTAPAGTKKIGFYAIAWNTNNSIIKFSTESGDLDEQFELVKNAGFKSNKPYTIEITEADYYEFAVDFTEDTEVTIETLDGSERRALLIGLTTYAE